MDAVKGRKSRVASVQEFPSVGPLLLGHGIKGITAYCIASHLQNQWLKTTVYLFTVLQFDWILAEMMSLLHVMLCGVSHLATRSGELG